MSGGTRTTPPKQKAHGMSTSENREARFLAKITTGTTHEVRNVLAIIQESAGLIEDMVRSFERSGPLKLDKIIRSVDRIGTQVRRGAELMSTLNRFAHSLDHNQDQIDLNQEALQVALLCGRLAKQKGHQIEVRRDEKDITFTVNRLQLQMALFAGLECCLEQLPEPGTVVMHCSRPGDVPTVEFIGEVGDGVVLPAPTEASGWERVVEYFDLFGATIDTKCAPSHFRAGFPFAGAK